MRTAPETCPKRLSATFNVSSRLRNVDMSLWQSSYHGVSLSKWIHLLRVKRRQHFTCAVATWTVAPPTFVVIVADKRTSTNLAFSAVLSRSSFLCALCWDFGHWTPCHAQNVRNLPQSVQCSPSKHETHMPRGSLQDRVAPKAISIRTLLKLWSHQRMVCFLEYSQGRKICHIPRLEDYRVLVTINGVGGTQMWFSLESLRR